MEKFTNKKFIDYYLKNTEESIENLNNKLLILSSLKKDKIRIKYSSEEIKKAGSVVHNIELWLTNQLNSNIFKFVDLFNSVISSINCKSYGGAVCSARSILEHFGMLSLMAFNYEKQLKDKNYLKLSKILANWFVFEDEQFYLSDYKIEHVNNGIRHLEKFFKNKFPDDKYSENDFMSIYGKLSKIVHPAAPSIMVYADPIGGMDGDGNIDGTTNFSNDSEEIENRIFGQISWVLWILSYFLIEDLIPNYKKNIISRFHKEKDKLTQYFNINKNEANLILKSVYSGEGKTKYEFDNEGNVIFRVDKKKIN